MRRYSAPFTIAAFQKCLYLVTFSKRDKTPQNQLCNGGKVLYHWYDGDSDAKVFYDYEHLPDEIHSYAKDVFRQITAGAESTTNTARRKRGKRRKTSVSTYCVFLIFKERNGKF